MSFLLDKQYIKATEEFLAYSSIPPQPKIISDINKEISKPNADLETVSDFISRDVTMSAKLLKVVNSVFFGLREKVDSIHRALSLIGIKNFRNIILASSLREAFGSKDINFEKFWNHSMSTASFASRIARKVDFHSPEQAYLAGLFHDCGVPILLKSYKDYPDIIDDALSIVPVDSLSGKSKSIIGVEHERYSTHHCAVGYLVAKKWNMSDAVCDAIWHHHYVKVDIHNDEVTKKLVAIVLLADYMSSSLSSYAGGGFSVDPESEWAKMHDKVISELSINLDSVLDLKQDLQSMMQ